ncbi:DEAD/DEAH box helicase [Leptolyngbya sp. GGD]|uniref:DEAD/DEAH box helicase n=1 Tax=Leptolyngbya sp. GGD TaxID=2997907 RepID=UPI00227C8FA5|nr:DEAD/DEAH box helicase [Leptolyngbya sp. GGD]MCY6494535.1 DEAD/DEAH box helicase [Leptolyngbya sp. GGD]
MVQANDETISLSSDLIERFAGRALLPSFAKLYSHHQRLIENQPGLPSWRQGESSQRLNDVIRLINAALIQKQIGDERWRSAMRRSGEILEWLSLSEQHQEEIPVLLLASAAYQIAGYPAMAAGILKREAISQQESRILVALLKADFVDLFRQLTGYWSTSPTNYDQPLSDTLLISEQLHSLIIRETSSALGVLCAAMRWGDEVRIERAIRKLDAVGKALLHDYNPYSWLLAKLCAEVASSYVASSMRSHLHELSRQISESGQSVLEKYLRQNYLAGRALAWTSQVRGIEQLVTGESFALCTPTGSGKTTIAEIAILQSLFLPGQAPSDSSGVAPLIIYLVPSRALATEVEAKLARVLKNVAPRHEPIIVTGLYGGTDWGPTDAWLTSEERTVLICTYEKAEALMKFLGPMFLHRVSLVVIDEAHTVQFKGNLEALRKAESRELRLEALGARLFNYLSARSRVIALSAVAAESENALAGWVTRQVDATPVKINYRSTRQLIGRLECLPGRGFEIRYDLLDGASLQFQGEAESETPFIPNPFRAYPAAGRIESHDSPAKRMRPFLFWAAMNLASLDERGESRSVLISITQQIGGYADDFLRLLRTWRNEIPPFFQPPTDDSKRRLWERSLLSCEDYFGRRSREYRLLEKGVVVHHSKMPGLMARLLIELIDKRIITLVLATSTLSEGVNLPFETVLIPSLKRHSGTQPENLSVQEFGNLVGRAGRPGIGTEGRSLVVLMNVPSNDRRIRSDRNLYASLIREFRNQRDTDNSAGAISALATLLRDLEEQWQRLSENQQRGDFLVWLEQTAPLALGGNGSNIDDEESQAIESLDTLDSVLLSALVEIELIATQELSLSDLEERLQAVWRQTYAYYAHHSETRLEQLFVLRGRSLKTTIYPDLNQRRRLYRTSLPPRSGNQLLALYAPLREHLVSGRDYVEWSQEQQLRYLQATIETVGQIPKFRIKEPRGQVTWDEILCWWLRHREAPRQPTDSQVSDWHGFVSQNFGYRFNWGVGSFIALAIDEAFGGEQMTSSLENWPQTGLPWIVFWMKELLVWGTLDPVAAYLLARADQVSNRRDAEELAQAYYQSVSGVEPNERLNAATIKDWVQRSFREIIPGNTTASPVSRFNVSLLRDFRNAHTQSWRVIPVTSEDEIRWFDPAGFPLARCSRPENWQPEYLTNRDFTLNSRDQVVSTSPYV